MNVYDYALDRMVTVFETLPVKVQGFLVEEMKKDLEDKKQ